MSLESWVGAVLRPDSTARVPLSPRAPAQGRLPSVARGPCPVVGCRPLPETPAQG
ncbi:unnamed protein product [Staurois parvus]|uniref:Uncharacterized protein n=1 Tax=Staurois parvus TaxID=386267 RepID=A0ABN9DHP3_9NEOB|nr:unnamed protein product [Staurois parvus]